MKILLCTVGGSHAPILTALYSSSWDHVEFVCTDNDPAAGTPGSVSMVRDHVQVPARPAMPASRLPSIPDQAGLDPACWSVCLVSPDDPDGIFGKLVERLSALQAAHPGAEIVVDFTGGTKSMSVGAALAVTARPPARLQVTTGTRSDLVRVLDGTQQPIVLRTDRLVVERQIALLRAAWQRFGYEEAALGFASLVRDYENRIPADLLARLKFWRLLAQAFAAWDRFDRKVALANIKHAARKLPPSWRRYVTCAEGLLPVSGGGSCLPLALFDLLRNAERRHVRGRYDDAVARCYRLWEWSVQWLLQIEDGIDTSRVDPTEVPPEIIAGLKPREPSGRFEIGSDRAWRLYRCRHPESGPTRFWTAAGADGMNNEKLFERHAFIRNHSILAHGDRPIGADESGKIVAWTADPFIEMVRAEARHHGAPDDVPQLPDELPEPDPNQGNKLVMS